MDPQVSDQDIINYYDYCEIDYRWLWHLREQSAMHYGFWHAETKLLRDALKNMNDYVLGKMEIQNGDNLLDAGCGIGGTSVYAARLWNCHMQGITLSEKQVQTATNLAQSKKLKGTAQFSAQNYCHTRFPNESFNGVFGIESICHATDKEVFLKEAARLLKPGGRLVIADFFKSRNAHQADDEKLLQDWAHSWAVPEFSFYGDFIDWAQRNGLRLVENNDITDHIRRSARRLYWCFYPGLFC
ncbi:MAG TPA: class I SAM-dependent methyltransferase, partial [Saprospiraceae bacterium]|nr:class I SAM-dependent methyltransferase [Saprospiraceae bacterium]